MTVHDIPEAANIGIDTETLAYIALKAKAYDVLVAPDDTSHGSNGTDDRMMDVLEDEPDNPAGRELRAAIAGLNNDAQTALIALAWLGRDDYDADEWSEATESARDRDEMSASRYLMGMPLLGDYIEIADARVHER